MKIEVKKTITHGEFAKYMVDKFGIASFERNLADGEWFGEPSDRYNASINLKPAKYDDFAHSIRIDEDGVTFKTFEEITEDTVIPEMLTIYFNGDSRIHNNKRLNDLNTTYHIKSAYIMNDDLRLILIWRNGKLVE